MVNATEKAQVAGIAGGIQKHSMGGGYPYHVIGFAHGNSTKWLIQNLQTGEIAVTDEGLPRQWINLEMAEDYADKVRYDPERTAWSYGRLYFEDWLVRIALQVSVYKEPKPLFAVYRDRKIAEINRINRPLTPREEYELAIAVENDD